MVFNVLTMNIAILIFQNVFTVVNEYIQYIYMMLEKTDLLC